MTLNTEIMVIVPQLAESVLFITLDSCRYDTFIDTQAPNLKSIGKVYKAMAPSYFTYASHQAMFVGFTPGIAEEYQSFLNPKYGKIFRMAGSAAFSRNSGDYFSLRGKNIIDGFKRQGFLTIGSGAVAWFNPATETGQNLTKDFDDFYYPGDTYSLDRQLDWISKYLQDSEQKVFVFLNIGETHTPYYHKGASWDKDYNPCIPFGENNSASECRKRQRTCLEYVDSCLKTLLDAFADSTIFFCADHGDCWGEDGLWEHGFHHQKVLQVPLIFKLGAKLAPNEDPNDAISEYLSPIAKLEQKLRAYEQELSCCRQELQETQAKIQGMKTSKFWKLRNFWFKVKALLGFR